MPEHGPLPLVGLPADVFFDHGLAFHKAGEKYLRPLAEISAVLPVILPAGGIGAADRYLERLDGVLLTGALSNVHPQHYGETPGPHTEPHDDARDTTSLALIRHAITAGLPVFAICRGIHEFNVALGGSLLAEVQELPGRLDHRAPNDDRLEVRYGPNHPISIVEGGMLHDILGCRETIVNSLHRQAIDTLGPGLRIEATAPDGTIEAVSVPQAPAFALGVQWHPEYNANNDAVSRKLFGAFGDAVRQRMAKRRLPRQAAPAVAISGGMGSWTSARAQQNE